MLQPGRKGRCCLTHSLLQLGLWLDGEAAARLQEMGAEEWSPESFLGSDEQFNEFLAQATVCLRGLSWSTCPWGSTAAQLRADT